MTREEEFRHLQQLRGCLDRLMGDDWQFDTHGRERWLFVQRATGEQVHVCTIHADALADEAELICRALPLLQMLDAMIARAADKIKAMGQQVQQQERKARAENFGFMAKGLCEKRDFWLFLDEISVGGKLASPQAADTRLKNILGIASKGDLNSDPAKRDQFLDLRRRFYQWLRGGQ